MNILIFGAGYVGLSLAVLLARLNKIVLFDVNKSKIDQINEGTSTIDEELLKNELKRNLKNISVSIQ